MSTHTNPFKRSILSESAETEVATILQQSLVNLVDLGLQLKQAHWNVLGSNFRAVHLQLDEILITVRDASDETAERMTTLGLSPDGRAATVAKQTSLSSYPEGFQKVETTLTMVADALKAAIDGLRSGIERLGDLDPISEDMFIGISAGLEKHLWMIQAQEIR